MLEVNSESQMDKKLTFLQKILKTAGKVIFTLLKALV